MFPLETFIAYTAACLVLVLVPGPDNFLAIARGLSQGRLAACVAGIASGAGIVFHVIAATFGLTLLMQTSEVAFWAIKMIGAGYLLWLGIKALRNRSFISFTPATKTSLRNIFATGFLSAALNPKPGFFVLAFIPQFVSPARGSVTIQMIFYGLCFALLTAVGFALMGIFASRLSPWLRARSRVFAGLNLGAGVTFIASGLSIAVLKR